MKPLVKAIIIASISAFAVIVGIIVIVIINRILKKTNEDKRRKIRQQHREEIDRMLMEDLKKQQTARKSVYDNQPDNKHVYHSAPKQENLAKQEEEEEKPKKISQKKPSKLINHHTPQFSSSVLQDFNRDFDVLIKQLPLEVLLTPEQLENIRAKRPKDLAHLVKLVKEEMPYINPVDEQPTLEIQEEEITIIPSTEPIPNHIPQNLQRQFENLHNMLMESTFIPISIFQTSEIPSEIIKKRPPVDETDEDDDPKIQEIHDTVENSQADVPSPDASV